LSDDTANSPKKVRGRPFPKGQSANPSGRPLGSRNTATLYLEKLMGDQGEAVVNSVVEAAINGDMTAAKIIVDRIVPLRKGRPVTIELPPVKTADDVAEAVAALLAQTAKGELTPDEAGALAGILDLRRRSIETVELADQVADLRETLKQLGAGDGGAAASRASVAP
jgi:hypothetical protein